MKTINFKTVWISVFFILVLLFSSCDLNTMGGFGTLVIALPGNNLSRAVGDEISKEFIETLRFRVECSGPGTVSREFGAGDSASINLTAGSWNIAVKVLNAAGENIAMGRSGANSTASVIIESGVTTTIQMPITIDTSRCNIARITLEIGGVKYAGIINEDNVISVKIPAWVGESSIEKVNYNVTHTGVSIEYPNLLNRSVNDLDGEIITVTAENGTTKSYSIALVFLNDDNPNDDNLGDYYLGESLNFSGQVYMMEEIYFDFPDSVPYAGPDLTINTDIGGGGSITGGQLSFQIDEPLSLLPIADVFEESGEEEEEIVMYSNYQYTPAGAQANFLTMRAEEDYMVGYEGGYRELKKHQQKSSMTSEMYTLEEVSFLYVDRDVTVTARGGQFTLPGEGWDTAFSYSVSNLNLSLKKGWNAIYTKEVAGINSFTITVSLGNPSIPWTLLDYEYDNGGGSDYTWIGPPANHTLLTENQWEDGDIINSSDADWYSISVTAGVQYNIWWNDYLAYSGDGSKTLDVKVSAWYSDGTKIFIEVDAAWYNSESFVATSTGTVYVRVWPYYAGYGYGDTGTYGIVYSTNSTRPWNPPASSVTLIENDWAVGSMINYNSTDWYSFPVTGGTTYYIWWDDSHQGSITYTLDVIVNAWFDDGTEIFGNEDSGYDNSHSFSVPAGFSGLVYIQVFQWYLDEPGTYGLVYSTSNARPPAN